MHRSKRSHNFVHLGSNIITSTSLLAAKIYAVTNVCSYDALCNVGAENMLNANYYHESEYHSSGWKILSSPGIPLVFAWSLGHLKCRRNWSLGHNAKETKFCSI